MKIRHDSLVMCEAKFRIKQRGYRTSTEIAERYAEYLNDEEKLYVAEFEEALYLALTEVRGIDNIDYYYEGNDFGNLKISVMTGS